MAHLITLQLEAPPDTVDVMVDFYDDQERAALLSSPGGPSLAGIPKLLPVPTCDLCTYYLYYKKRLEIDGYSSHNDIVQRWHQALVEFDGQVQFANSSLRLLSPTDFSTGTTERLGEAIGLSVVSSIHQLHQADWDRIGKTNIHKTLDFVLPWTASDGKQFIQLETKGSAGEDNAYKTSSVSNHKADIKAKKDDASDEEHATSILYGTISVLDNKPESVARCWLVDPQAEGGGDPTRYKILTRLAYIADLVTFIGSRSALAASLQTRLAALNALTDITPLDRLPLRKGNGSVYSVETFDTAFRHNPWFAGKSVVSDGPAGGQVFPLDKSHLLLIGMREELVVHAVQQDFQAIQKYSFSAGTVGKWVECVVPAGRFRSEFDQLMQIPDNLRESSPAYVRFRMRGHLHYTQSGLVLGILPIPEVWQRS